MMQMSLQQRGQQAQTLAGLGRLQEALVLVEAAPASEREALMALRISILKALERPEAVVPLRRAQVKAAPNSMVAHHNLASALGDAGAAAEAETEARKALSLGGKAPETWLVLARALQAQHKLEEAIAAYGEVMARRSDYLEAINEQAQLLWMSGADVGTAREPYTQALVRHPALAQLHQAQAIFNAYVGQPEREVWQELTQGAAKAGLQVAGIETDAAHLALAFDPALAVAHARKAVALPPNDIASWTTLAKALLVTGEVGEAREILSQLLPTAGQQQIVLALHATALRMADEKDPLGLDDGDGLIRATQIDTPDGWGSLSAYLADLKVALEAQHAFNRHPIGQSLRHGSQTPVDLRRVDDPAIKAFFSAIDGPIRRYLAALGTGNDPVRSRNTGEYRFAGCWSIRLRSGGFHEAHIHSKGWLSSACYIDLPPAVDRGGQEGWIGFGVPPFNLKQPLVPLKVEKPEPGKLVLFPSCMWHGTLPFDDDHQRLTIAFDLVPA
ncbi:putative 2OG-Fe(II) oxygenase [Brevundimonas terrae]|uniref:2OG-Fe(II) oxygenase n=2 Tax=Brevundimonas terrae TaxID=363631 RepID=A0ABN0YH56_9CAUL